MRIICLIFILGSPSLYSQNLDYIEFLLSKSEYDIARTELYELLYSSSNEREKVIYYAEIGYTYQKEGDYKKALGIYREIASESPSVSEGLIETLKLNMSASLLEMNAYEEAFSKLNEIGSELSHQLLLKRLVVTAERSHETERLLSDSELASLNRMRERLKNPKLAAGLSTIFPGTGQFYSNHYIDGLQALLVVGVGTTYSLIAIRNYRKERVNPILMTLTVGSTLMFHYANIISGYRTALYRNKKIKQEYLKENLVFFEPLDFLKLLPKGQ